MAGFKTHVTVSSLLGVGYGGAAYFGYDLPWPTCLLAGGLCGISGMLPDIDSDSGTPVRESMAFFAAIVPMMLLHRFQQMGMSHELMILSAAAIYVVVRFGFGELLKRYTVHRGMFHSVPAAVVFGEIAFLLSAGEDMQLRLYKAGAVVLGYMSHLLLDEIYSIEWQHGRLRLKNSFGTALKFFGHSSLANVSVYAKLLLLSAVIFYEPQWTQSPTLPTDAASVQQTAEHLIDTVWKR
jgi:hypothetical protein